MSSQAEPRTFTHPDVLAAVAAGAPWADRETDPARIDWAARQAAAAIPFQVVDGRPVNPGGSTGIRYGRNELGHWGEQLCADALVTFVGAHTGWRWLLMVERSDGHGWALPGGYVEPGENVAAAALRELAEETGLNTRRCAGTTEAPRYVPDPRASDEAWMVTVLTRINLGILAEAPRVAGADDAKQAHWVRADSFSVLERHLATVYDGVVFPAHRVMLADALGA